MVKETDNQIKKYVQSLIKKHESTISDILEKVPDQEFQNLLQEEDFLRATLIQIAVKTKNDDLLTLIRSIFGDVTLIKGLVIALEGLYEVLPKQTDNQSKKYVQHLIQRHESLISDFLEEVKVKEEEILLQEDKILTENLRQIANQTKNKSLTNLIHSIVGDVTPVESFED